MKIKNLQKYMIFIMLLAQFTLPPSASYAEIEKREGNNAETEWTSVDNPGKGLLGYYFQDNKFSDLTAIQPYTSGGLILNNKISETLSNEGKHIQSARWLGYIKPSKTEEYQLSTSADQNVIIQLDGRIIINRVPMEQRIKLEKDKLYEIKIEYQGDSNSLLDLKFFWSTSDVEKELIPDENLRTPNFSEKTALPEESNLIPENNLFEREKVSSRSKRNSTPQLQDIDKDGIPDEWELNGYTIRHGILTTWKDDYSSEGYKKYVSHPYNSRTAADPYTDLQKVSGNMPTSTKPEARDPLVAAYPAVGVKMEKLIISKNENVTEGSQNTKAIGTTKTKTNANTVEIGGKMGWSNKTGLTFEFTPKYVHSWTSGTAVQETKGESWSKQIGINTEQAAFLNANVRYYNAGTAPIYDVRPTTNFILRNAKQTLTTIKAGPNQIGNNLPPGETYPKKGQGPISLDRANAFGIMKISMNAAQLDSLQSQGESIDLETTQSGGQYGVLDPSTGILVTDSGKQWDHILSDIEASSGSLILDIGKEVLERRVAARDVNNPEDKTPIITVKEAIKKAFGAVEREGLLYYKEKEMNKEIPLHESAINIIVDETTKNEFNKQLDKMQKKSVYDITFKRGMSITFHTPIMYDDFENKNNSSLGWSDVEFGDSGHSGKSSVNIGVNSVNYSQRLERVNLKPYTMYTLRAWVKGTPYSLDGKVSNHSFSIHLNSGDTSSEGLNERLELNGTEWQLFEFTFDTQNRPDDFTFIGIKNTGSNVRLSVDDLSISEWGPSEIWLRNHVLSHWHTPKPGYVDGITFSKVPNTKLRYQLEIDGKFTDIKSVSQVDSQGTQYIDFKDFNNGKSIDTGSYIAVYAVYGKNESQRVKVAEHGDRDIMNQLRLRPLVVTYFYKLVQNSYTFEIKTGENAPNAVYKVWNVTKNITYYLGHRGSKTSTWIDNVPYYPKDEYAVVAVMDGKEYVVFKDIGKNIYR
ncbi:binary toxin-like calcium binding domain-containing protein [Bacillus cereus]|uniref:binary toxin-like calcium binding domain-containing protein n=1 Tax=Bacillus cereus TaxID=1396 RepID=UPI000C21883D|nr:binary toxin-like calcium binding domain-containing protein [Bacillus cereus]